MKVCIITEGGQNIGFGHINRCLSLYQAFQERGITPELIINGDNSIEYFSEKANYQILNWLKEKQSLFKKLKDIDIAIIDSYLADISIYNKLSHLVKMVVYINGYKRVEYPRGIILNGNIYAKRMNYPKINGTKYLLGVKYTPLRKEFWEVPEKKIKETIGSIMITFGGDDAKNMTPKVLTFLNEKYTNLFKSVIIGRAFRNIDDIKKYTGKNTNLVYYPDAKIMKELMLESDIAISACGQTLNELARVGVPTIGICVAENQIRNAEEWEKIGFLEYAGWYNNYNLINKISYFIEHLKDSEKRKAKFKTARKIIDGKGSINFVEKIISLF